MALNTLEVNVDDVERLVAIEQIRRMRSRYLRMLDTKNWDEVANAYAPDATLAFHTEAPGIVSRGRTQIIAMITSTLVDVDSVHYAHTAEIDLLSPHRATGVWALEDKLWFGPKSMYPGRRVHAYGHLEDSYSKIDGRWLLQDVQITRLRVDHYTDGG
jgi:hypothetical protein